jgi:hypothetical protein
MADDKHIVALDDLDALLRKEMSIEPSPGFLPRVRERVNRRPQPVREYWPWRSWLIGAAAAAVCVVALILNVRSEWRSDIPATPQPLVLRTPPSIATGATAPAREPRVAGRGRSSNPGPHADPLVTPSSDSPDVIVDQRQRVAFVAVIRMVSDGRLTDDAFAQTTQPSLQPIREQVAPIAVTPLELSTVAVGGVLRSEK